MGANAVEKAVGKPAEQLAARREDLYLPDGPKGFDIIEITGKSNVSHGHVYMENYVFTPDSRRFVFYRRYGYTPGNGAGPSNPIPHRCEIFLCDMDDGYSVRQLTDEDRVGVCNIAPDGKHVVYFVDHTGRPGFMLKRVNIETGLREVLMTVDKPLAGYSFAPICTGQMGIRIDGNAVCTQSMVMTPWEDTALYLSLVLDLNKSEPQVILEGNDFSNQHLQYAKKPDDIHDIMVQHNHGFCTTYSHSMGGNSFLGDMHRLIGAYGCDIHAIRDDGRNYRDFPWGRNGWEHPQGHQCWLGTTGWAVTSTGTRQPDGSMKCNLIAGNPMYCADNLRHTGLRLPDAEKNRVLLSREMPVANFCHFAFDPTGVYYVSDWIEPEAKTPELHAAMDTVVIGKMTSPAGDGLYPDSVIRQKPLCYSKCIFIDQPTHPHPTLSPDHKTVLFNIAEPGKLPQAVAAHVTEDMF